MSKMDKLLLALIFYIAVGSGIALFVLTIYGIIKGYI